MKSTCLHLAALALLIALPLSASAQEASTGAPGGAAAQQNDSGRATVESLGNLHTLTVTNLVKTAEMLDNEMYAYRPTAEVRTSGQILAHVADAQYMFCSTAAAEDNPSETSVEQSAASKEEIVAALKGAAEYCTGIYAEMTDEQGAEMRSLFGRQMTAAAILAFNSVHNYEHYGNLVTYMRINGLVPPSSMQ